MFTIVYASKATTPMDVSRLVDLLGASRARNETCGITGLLLYAHGSFMQQIEGPEEAVTDVFASIERDHRHGSIRVLTREAVTERRFGTWSMGFDHPSDEDLSRDLPGFKPSVLYPLVHPDLVHDGSVAQTLLGLYALNP